MSQALWHPWVTVVIPVLNGMPFLRECVTSALTAIEEYGSADLIIVDNGSIDGSYELIRDGFGDLCTLERYPAVNVGAVRNRGAKCGKGEVLAFIDADCVVPPGYLIEAVNVLYRTGAAASGSSYALPSDCSWIERVWDQLHRRDRDGPVGYLPAGNFVCRRRVFEGVGGFDETLATGEDAELGKRLRKGGFLIHESAAIRAVHLGNPKTLAEFFRKQRWHGRGALGTARHNLLDKPLLLTLLHWVLIPAGFLSLALGGGPSGMLALAASNLVAPGLALAYRALQARRRMPFLKGFLLYWLYFTARGLSLMDGLFARVDH